MFHINKVNYACILADSKQYVWGKICAWGEFWKCETCNETFDERKNLKEHEKVHGIKNPCEKCGKGFEKAWSLKQHISTFHEGKKPFICDFCGNSFGRKDNLKDHINQVHIGIKRTGHQKKRNKAK